MLGKIVETGQDTIYIKLEDKSSFKLGDEVNVSKQKKKRTLKQNNFYWAYLTWCIHPFGGDLQSSGHFSVDAFHEDVKAWIEATHNHDFPIDKKFSSAGLDKKEFGRFFDLVNAELMIEILGVDTSQFFIEYEKYGKWIEYNSEDFRAFMNEKVPPTPF